MTPLKEKTSSPPSATHQPHTTWASLSQEKFLQHISALEKEKAFWLSPNQTALKVEGPDAQTFLNGLATNNTKDLQPNQAQASLFCLPKGQILATLLVIQTQPNQFILLSPDKEPSFLAEYLESYHFNEEVDISLILLAQAEVFAASLSPDKKIDTGKGEIEGLSFFATPHPWGALSSSILLASPPNMEKLLQKLVGEKGFQQLHPQTLEELRIFSGKPKMGKDFSPEKALPEELRLVPSHLSFSKGCYTGQEIHVRMHHRGHPNFQLYNLTWKEEEGPKKSGLELSLNDQALGTLTSSSTFPIKGHHHGLAMLKIQPLKEKLLIEKTFLDQGIQVKEKPPQGLF